MYLLCYTHGASVFDIPGTADGGFSVNTSSRTTITHIMSTARTTPSPGVATSGHMDEENQVWARREPAKLKFPPCTVCGRQAIGTHYGAITCGACKVFFARFLRKNEIFTCKKDGKCPINDSPRGNCKGCRLTKCISVGMARENSSLGRYNQSKRAETIMKEKGILTDSVQKGVDNNNECDLKTGINESAVRAVPTTVSETSQKYSLDVPISFEFDGLDQSPHLLLQYDATLDMLETALSEDSPIEENAQHSDEDLDIICTTLRSSLSVSGTPRSYNDNVIVNLVESFHGVCLGKKGDASVKDEDFPKLQQEAYDLHLRKLELFGEMKPIGRDEFNEVYKQCGLEIDDRFKFWENVDCDFASFANEVCRFAREIPLFLSLSKRDQTNLIKAGFNDLGPLISYRGFNAELRVCVSNSFIMHIDDIVGVWMSSACAEAMMDCFKKTQQISPSPIECALLAVMCIVSTGRCKLENPALVEKIQEMTAERLKVEVTKTHGSYSSRRFGKLFDVLLAIRRCAELYSGDFKEMCTDEVVWEKSKYALKSLPEDV